MLLLSRVVGWEWEGIRQDVASAGDVYLNWCFGAGTVGVWEEDMEVECGTESKSAEPGSADFCFRKKSLHRKYQFLFSCRFCVLLPGSVSVFDSVEYQSNFFI